MGAIGDLVTALRRRGVVVHEWPGWDGRGNADGGVGPPVPQISPVGAVLHHTATPYGAAYPGLVSSTRPGLEGGCLANFAGNADGSLTVLASGLAWHAGPGVGPNLGRVLAKVPNIRARMNRLTVGLEIVYPGDKPMTAQQHATALVFARTCADLFAGGDLEAVRGHAETNGAAPGGAGKWDPGYAPGKTLDMAAFRAAAAALPTLLEDDVPYSEADLRRIVGEAVWLYAIAGTNARDRLQGLDAIQVPAANAALADVRARLDRLAAATGGTTAAGQPIDYPALARAICDEQDRRARDGNPQTGPVS